MKNNKRKYIFIIAGVILLFLVTYNLVNYIAHRKIDKYFAKNKTELPIKSFEKFHVNIWNGSLRVKNAEIVWDKNDRNSAKIKNLSIKGLKLIKLWRKEDIDIRLIEIKNTELTLIKGKPSDEEKEKTDKEEKNKDVPFIHVDKIKLKNLVLIQNDKEGKNLTHLKITKGTFKNFNIKDVDKPHEWFETLDSYELEVTELNHKTSDWEILEAKKLTIDNKEYKAEKVRFYTELGIKEYNARLPHERDHYDISIPEIKISATHWDKDYDANRQRFKVDSIIINSPELEIYRDKLLPDDESNKPMFSQLLRELNFDIQTEVLKINDGDIKYNERVNEDNNGGTVHLSDFNAIVNDAGNFKEVNKDKDVQIHVESTFMESGAISADWHFNTQNTSDVFNFKAKIQHLQAKNANAFIEPNLKVRMEGKLDEVYININGNRAKSNADFAIRFHELHVDLLKKDNKEKNKLLSAIANIFVKKDSKTKDDEYMNEASVEIERDTTKSIFNFLWKNTLEGLKETTINKL